MRNSTSQPALLTDPSAPHLPPTALNISARLQLCVDAGAACAVSFFDEITSVGLHDHIATSMHAFLLSLRTTASQGYAPGLQATTQQECTDAFAAGYLGRIQQQLRIFHKADAPGVITSEAVTH